MTIRRAKLSDAGPVSAIYEEIHTEEEEGCASIGWVRGVYPTIRTAQAALDRGDLFVLEENGEILGAAIINQIQVDVYGGAPWRFSARDEEVMVLHTLVISPRAGGIGYGKAFVAFYEKYAAKNGCPYLRMDTNEKNSRARALYQKLGYSEISVAPTTFNGIPTVNLVLLEKKIEGE